MVLIIFISGKLCPLYTGIFTSTFINSCFCCLRCGLFLNNFIGQHFRWTQCLNCDFIFQNISLFRNTVGESNSINLEMCYIYYIFPTPIFCDDRLFTFDEKSTLRILFSISSRFFLFSLIWLITWDLSSSNSGLSLETKWNSYKVYVTKWSNLFYS